MTGYNIDTTWDKEENLYISRCIEIPCCLSYDPDKEESIRLVHVAIEGHLKYLKKMGVERPRKSTISFEDIGRLRKEGLKSAKELDEILEKVFRHKISNLVLR